MNLISDMWILSELCSHNKQDSGDGDLDKRDFIKDKISASIPDSIFIQMENNIEYCYIVETEKRIVVVFRGTDGGKAWKNNFKLAPPYIDGYMHRGFYELAEYFYRAIVQYFRVSFEFNTNNFSSCPKPVYFTGHSLGGILSQYLAKFMYERNKLVSTCVNFGAPVGGLRRWKYEIDRLPIQNIRVVNGYDLVPDFLDDTIGSHGGKLIHLPQPKWHKFFIWRRLMDHAYSSYTDALIKYSEELENFEAVNKLKEVRKQVNI